MAEEESEMLWVEHACSDELTAESVSFTVETEQAKAEHDALPARNRNV